MARGSGVEPFRIHAVHPVLQSDLFWRGDFNCIKAQLKMARTGRER
jgi:hypothetical protein